MSNKLSYSHHIPLNGITFQKKGLSMEQTTTPAPRLLFVEPVAAMLGRTPAQLRWMITQGTAPRSAVIAGRRCFRIEDVEKFIEDAFADAG